MRYKIIYDIDRDESTILDEELGAAGFKKGLPEEDGALLLVSKDLKPKILDFNNKSLLKKYLKSLGKQILYFKKRNGYYIFEVPDISLYRQKNVSLYSYIVNQKIDLSEDSILIEDYGQKLRIFDGTDTIDVDMNLSMPFINQLLNGGKTVLYSNTEKFKDYFKVFNKINLFDIFTAKDFIISKKIYNKGRFKLDFLMTKISVLTLVCLIILSVYFGRINGNLNSTCVKKQNELINLKKTYFQNNELSYSELLKKINLYGKITDLYALKPLNCHILSLNILKLINGYSVNFNFIIKDDPLNFKSILYSFKNKYESRFNNKLHISYKIETKRVIFTGRSEWLIRRSDVL